MAEQHIPGRGIGDPEANFGQRLIALRREKGFNQAELARRIGVHPSAVNHWEKGRGYLPTERRVWSITRVLDLNEEEERGLRSVLEVVAPRNSRDMMITIELDNGYREVRHFRTIHPVTPEDLERLGAIIPRIVDAYFDYKKTIERVVRESFELPSAITTSEQSSQEPTIAGQIARLYQ